MTKPKFRIGDMIRRMSDGRQSRVIYVAEDAYHFDNGGFALIDDQDRYTLVEQSSGFFRVSREVSGKTLDEHVSHGFEDRRAFQEALMKLTDRWGGREGEAVDERHDHLRLRFHDTPGGRPDEAWLPIFLLESCPRPDYLGDDSPTPLSKLEQELDEIFGFD